MMGSPHGPSARAPESSGKPFDPREPDALHFARIAIEHAHAMVDQNLMNLTLGAGFEIVVAQNGHDRDAHRRVELFREPRASSAVP